MDAQVSSESVGQSSDVEQALVDLLGAPFDKVSITLPSALRARVAARAETSSFSSYVAEVLAREERRLALIAYLDEMDEFHGPPTADERVEADRRWEEMWGQHESSAVSSSTPAR